MMESINKNKLLLSFIVALYADILSVNTILVAINSAFTGVMSLLYMVVLAFIIVCVIINPKSEFKIDGKIVMLCAVVVFAFTLRGSHSTALPIYFFCQVLLALLISQSRIDVNKFLFFVMTIPVFGIVFLSRIFQLSIEEDGSIGMGTSYSFVIPVVANIVYYFLVFKKKEYVSTRFRLIVYAISVINIIYAYNLVTYGARGVLLCLVSALLIIMLFDYDNNTCKIKSRSKWSILIFAAIIVFAINIWDILAILNDVFISFGVENYALSRTIEYGQMGDAMTGRSDLFALVWREFMKEPLIGHGMRTFEANTGGYMPYPHNFFLQMLYDGGLLLTITVLGPVIWSLSRLFKQCNLSSYLLVLMLFCSTVPGALFSHDLWSQPVLWLFFGFSLTYNNIE